MKEKFMILTDGRKPFVSGVVTVLERLEQGLEKRGFDVIIVSPLLFSTVPLLGYKEIKVTFFPWIHLRKMLLEEKPKYIHIVYEGPIGWAGVLLCNRYNLKYTTSFHSKYPEYFNLRTGFSTAYGYKILKEFHKKTENLLVTTESLKEELEKKGFERIKIYPLGVDTSKFRRIEGVNLGYEKPIFTYMGRVSIEKNIEDFLKLKLPGTKMVIGKGPQKEELEKEYKDVKFVGYKSGEELVKYLSGSDVYVFPSKTETFGLSVLESMACGLPVIAYDVTGPKDIIINGYNGFVGNTLEENILKGLEIPRENPIKTAKKYSWDEMVEKFLEYQVPNEEN